MREMDAFEQAYKNGFAAGLKAAEEKIVRCRDCLHWGIDCGTEETVCLKIYSDGAASAYAWQERKPDDFCSYGERRSDG